LDTPFSYKKKIKRNILRPYFLYSAKHPAIRCKTLNKTLYQKSNKTIITIKF
jgi:hypothetical protein